MQFAPFTKQVRRRVTDAAVAHGYAPYGNPDGPELLFRTAAARLTVAWDRGYLSAAVAPRGADGEAALDDDLFRQAADGEPPHPDGVRREWTDADAFVTFLGARLPAFERAALAPDAELRARLAAAAQARAARFRDWRAWLALPPAERARRPRA